MTKITPRTTVVNVNRGTIDSNSKRRKVDTTAVAEAPISIRRGKSGRAVYGSEVAILDAQGAEVGRFIYSPDGKLLPCGARLVLVAHHGAKVVG